MPRQLLNLALLCLVAVASVSAADDELLTLKIRFHITEGVEMKIKGTTMEVWVKPAELSGVVITEINRIWRPAKIQFVIERNQFEPLLARPDRGDLLKVVENAQRGDDESGQSRRTQSIAKLLNPAERHPTAHNIYLLPYIGSTYQGYATMRGNQVVLGVWTDKASRGEQPPVRALLVEPEPMKVGSLARTIAHELGHNLGLTHPSKTDPDTSARLMGGRQQGYSLTAEEITTARAIARRNISSPQK